MNTLRTQDRRPTHPGAVLREDILPSLDMTQIELAQRLGVSRRTVSQIIHEHRPITPDMAIRLAHLLGGSAESWLNMQQALDVWELQHTNAWSYDKIKKVA
jgi:antitoxin HigA-1